MIGVPIANANTTPAISARGALYSRSAISMTTACVASTTTVAVKCSASVPVPNSDCTPAYV